MKGAVPASRISTEIEENQLDPPLSTDHFFEVEGEIENWPSFRISIIYPRTDTVVDAVRRIISKYQYFGDDGRPCSFLFWLVINVSDSAD